MPSVSEDTTELLRDQRIGFLGPLAGMSRRDAVESAVRLRLRPILMSTMTSIFGMLPMMLIPGSGTELYRGMAAVIIGGMLVSALFTLILLPSLLRSGEAGFPGTRALRT